MKSYRKVFTRDSAQRLYISRYENYENDCCENEICNNYINIKNYPSNFNNLTNKIILKLMFDAFRVKIKIVNFTTFLFLLYSKSAKITFFIKNRVCLRYVHNDVIIIDKLINVCINNRDDNAWQVEKEIAIDFNDKNATLIIVDIL